MWKTLKEFKSIFSHKNSVLKRWLISYLLVLVIPLLSTVAISYTAGNVVTDGIVKSNSIALSAIQATIDNRIEQSKQIISNLMLDRRFRDVTRKSNSMQDVVETQQYLINLLFNYSSTSPWLDILIYIPQWDYMITPKTAQPLPRLHRGVQYANRADISEEDWRQLMIQSSQSFGFVPSPYLSYSKYGEEALVYCMGTDKSVFSNYQHSCIFVSLQYSGIKDILDIPQGSAVMLLGQDGAVLSSFGEAFSGLVLPKAIDERANHVLEHNGTRYIYAHKLSQAAEINYAMLIPYNDYWQSFHLITLIAVLGLAATLMMGILTSLALLRRNYRPVQSVMKILTTADTGASSQNEFDLIREHLLRLADSRSSMESSMARQQHVLREAFLSAVLMGNRRHLSDEDFMEALQLDMEDSLFIPLSIFVSSQQEGLATFDLPIAFLLDNVLGELLQEEYSCYKSEHQNTVTFVFILRCDQLDAFTQALHSALEQMNRVFEQHFQLVLRAAVGRPAASIDELSASYKEIMDVHIYQIASTDSRILQVGQMEYRNEGSMPRTEEYAAMLVEAVLYQKVKDALYIATLFFDELLQSGESFKTARYHVFALVDKLTGVISRHEVLSAADGNAVLSAITASMSLAEQKRALQELIHLLCGQDPPKDEGMENSISAQIAAFVQAQYKDPNLSLTTIAEQVGLSVKYISKLFKLETGQGVLHYINTVRVQNAKLLLAQGGTFINEVAERVGYTNQKTFRRAFHKVEGINPSEYRA